MLLSCVALIEILFWSLDGVSQPETQAAIHYECLLCVQENHRWKEIGKMKR